MDIIQLPLDIAPPSPAKRQFVCPVCGLIFYRFRSKPQTHCSIACQRRAAAANYADRFWSKVRKTDGCWEWQGCCLTSGYGLFIVDKQTKLAHRVMWELVHGPITLGLCVLHKCDNPPCTNPAHLFLGTKGDNARDRVKKKRFVGPNHPQARFTQEQVDVIRARYAQGNVTQTALAREYGVGNMTMSNLVRGRSYHD